MQSLTCRPLPGNADCTYNVVSRDWSPDDGGAPSSRARRYSTFDLCATVRRRDVTFDFEDVFYRKCELDGSVYLVASKELVLAEATELREMQDGGKRSKFDVSVYESAPSSTPPRLLAEHALSQGDYLRYEGFKALAMNWEMCDDRCEGWRVPIAVVNVAQTDTFMQCINTASMPALLRASRLVDMKTNSVVHSSEHWLIMGFPHPGFDVPRAASKYFPLSRDLWTMGRPGCVSASLQRKLAGNAMHWMQASSMVLFTFASTVKDFNCSGSL